MTLSPHHLTAAGLAAPSIRPRFRWLSILGLALPMVFLAVLGGCNRFKKPPKPEIVYVVAQQTYLRDRVAAVSNRVALVQNGEPLEIVERGRRFLKVKTAKNEIGWIEDHLIIEEPVYDKFVALREQQEHDPVVATGVLRDSLYLHLTPGRTTERFYLLPENDKLQLLVRTSIPKPNSQQPPNPPPKPAAATPSSMGQKAAGQKTVGQKAAPAAKDLPAPVPMEDWWLVRDSQNHIGWLLARRMDVDIPDAIGGYSEG